MTTDTALGVTKLVVADRILLNKIPYIVRMIYYSRLFHLSMDRIILLSSSMQRSRWRCPSVRRSIFFESQRITSSVSMNRVHRGWNRTTTSSRHETASPRRPQQNLRLLRRQSFSDATLCLRQAHSVTLKKDIVRADPIYKIPWW